MIFFCFLSKNLPKTKKLWVNSFGFVSTAQLSAQHGIFINFGFVLMTLKTLFAFLLSMRWLVSALWIKIFPLLFYCSVATIREAIRLKRKPWASIKCERFFKIFTSIYFSRRFLQWFFIFEDFALNVYAILMNCFQLAFPLNPNCLICHCISYFNISLNNSTLFDFSCRKARLQELWAQISFKLKSIFFFFLLLVELKSKKSIFLELETFPRFDHYWI